MITEKGSKVSRPEAQTQPKREEVQVVASKEDYDESEFTISFESELRITSSVTSKSKSLKRENFFFLLD